jgi:hypothetical protein
MTSFWQDVQYSLRMIVKTPGYAAIAILTLALGIGANTTIFSWINATLLNPIPGLANPLEVVSLSLGRGADNPFPFTYPDFEMIRDGQRSFAGLTGCNPTPMSLTGKGKPERVWGTVASANYFDVLGVRPILGRGFMPEEDERPGGAPVAVISYRLCQTHFGANPGAVGQTIEINRHPYTIVGVAPAVFQGSQTGIRSEIWVPVMMEEQLAPRSDLLHDHHYFWFVVFGRLKPGVRPEQAQEEMTVLLKREVKNYPEEHRGHDSVTVSPLWRSPFGANQFLSMLLPMLMTIAGLVLLLACANVANLMLVRSVARRREIAIRMSLGASRWRLVRQLLVESLILAMAGGAIALLITFWSAGTFMKFVPAMDFPISLIVRADNREGIFFITLRRRSAKMLPEIYSQPDSAWRRISLPALTRIYRNPKVLEERVTLSGYKGELRQLTVMELGHEEPTILLTNHRKLGPVQLVTRYAPRMLIENGISEAVQFFPIDALSSMVGMKVDFDMQLTLVASSLYRMMAQRIGREYSHSQAKTVFRNLLNLSGKVEVTASSVVVTLDKRAHNLYLVASGLANQPTTMPWFGGKK